MATVEPPFATVDDLKDRWPGFPTGQEAYAETLLEDASQFILDACSDAGASSENTLRRIVCAVVRRSMQVGESEHGVGVESYQMGAGPYQETVRPVNPHGDFYLTRQERKALGCGRQSAGSIDLLANSRKAWEDFYAG